MLTLVKITADAHVLISMLNSALGVQARFNCLFLGANIILNFQSFFKCPPKGSLRVLMSICGNCIKNIYTAVIWNRTFLNSNHSKTEPIEGLYSNAPTIWKPGNLVRFSNGWFNRYLKESQPFENQTKMSGFWMEIQNGFQTHSKTKLKCPVFKW